MEIVRLMNEINERNIQIYRLLQKRRKRRQRSRFLNQIAAFCADNSQCTISRSWMYLQQQNWWDDIVPNMDEKEWKRNFRVSKNTYTFICNRLNDDLRKQDTQLRKCIRVEKKVAISIYALASTAEFRTIANLFGIGKSTVCVILKEFCLSLIRNCLGEQICFPNNIHEAKLIIDGFKNMWGFPQCVGAIDGCHIAVSPPKDDAIDYYNYKGWYSVVLLAVCDQSYKFTYINIGSPGRNNDAHIFNLSKISKAFQKQFWSLLNQEIAGITVPPCLIGDSAFPLLENLMKPYTYCSSNVQKLFNYQLSRARRVIENTFGRLKGRFRICNKRIELNIENVPNIVQSCCILHNICESLRDNIDESWISEENVIPTQTAFSGSSNNYAVKIRDAIAASF